MLEKFKIKIFADGADLKSIQEMNKQDWIKGFTTNPTLMRQAGVRDYVSFAKDVLKEVKNKPVSFEIFADEFEEMAEQAREINSWGCNVYVKIPVTNSQGKSAVSLIKELSEEGIKLNVTAIFTFNQIENIIANLSKNTPAILSVFAGRIADTGIDPMDIIKKALQLARMNSNIEILWASTREVFNLVQANSIGCHIITMSKDLLKKIHILNRDLEEYCLETVQMFYNDAKVEGYSIPFKILI